MIFTIVKLKKGQKSLMLVKIYKIILAWKRIEVKKKHSLNKRFGK